MRTRLLPLALLLTLLPAPVAADQPSAFDLMNRYRVSRQLGPLVSNVTLERKASGWARKIAADGELSHSRLSDGAPAGWVTLGENVGSGPTVEGIEQAFEASPLHEKNILEPAFTHAGVAVLEVRGKLWVVQEFADLTAPRVAAAATTISNPPAVAPSGQWTGRPNRTPSSQSRCQAPTG